MIGAKDEECCSRETRITFCVMIQVMQWETLFNPRIRLNHDISFCNKDVLNYDCLKGRPPFQSLFFSKHDKPFPSKNEDPEAKVDKRQTSLNARHAFTPKTFISHDSLCISCTLCSHPLFTGKCGRLSFIVISKGWVTEWPESLKQPNSFT